MKNIYHKLQKLFLIAFFLSISFGSAFSQVTEYIEHFDGATLPSEWSSTSGDITTTLVSDTDPYTGETVNAVKLSVDKTSRWSSFNLDFPNVLDLTNNQFVTIRLRNPDGIAGLEFRIYDESNSSWNYSNVVLAEGYNELYFNIGGSLDFSKVSRFQIRPSTYDEYTPYAGDIFIDFIKVGNNDVFPQDKAEVLNAFVRDGFNATSISIDTVSNSFNMEYAGPDDASGVRLYVATTNAANWENNDPTSRRDYDAGFTASLVSLQGTVQSDYSFSATRIDPNLRANIDQLIRNIDNQNYSNIDLEPVNEQIMAKIQEVVGGSLSGGTVTTPEGVTISIATSNHPNISTSGVVTYPAEEPVFGEIILSLTENGYSEEVSLDLYILPELLTGIDIPPLYSGISNRTIALPVDSLLKDEALFSSNLSFSYSVLDTTIISNISDSYTGGDKTLLLNMDVKNPGPAIVNIDINDAGNLVKSVKLGIPVFSPVTPENKGVSYKATDVAHWQTRPYKSNPTLKSGYPIVLDQTYLVESGMDFFHGIMQGILIPPRSGNYQFEIKGDGEGNQTLWLEQGVDVSVLPAESDPDNPVNYLANLNNNGVKTLEAGKPYYFEAHHKQIINSYEVKLAWKQPGDINFSYIPDNFVVQYVDFVLPAVVENISSVPGENVSLLRWEASSDDQKLKGYHVYVNGNKVNDTIISKQEYLIQDLTKESTYEIVVIAEDAFGNYSMPSAIHRLNTTATSSESAQLPDSIAADVITAFKAEFSWNSSPDALGYNVYLDGEKLNENFITDTTFKVTELTPEQLYQLTLKTLNVSFVESDDSLLYEFSTLAFDINNPEEEIYTAEVDISLSTVAKATGFGVHIDYNQNDMIAAERAAFDDLMQELQPAGMRFGAIGANSVSYSEVSGPGAKYVTFGEFAASSLQHGGDYVMLCTGPGPNTDYTESPTLTFQRLLEYLCGDETTEEGAKRVAEGYAQPFNEQMEVIIIELGNEVWGGESHQVPNHDYSYATYIDWVKEVTEAVEASPYYDPNKIYLSVSGRSPNFPDYQDRIFDGLGGDFPYLMSLSGYVGGNIMDQGEDFSDLVAESRLAYHKQSYDRMAYYLNNMDKINRAAIEKTGRIWPFYPYESNSTQQNYHGSLGQALLSIDYFHEYVKKGALIPTIFNLDGGQWRMVTKLSDGTYAKRPIFHMAAISNQTTRGGVLLESETNSAKTLTNHYGQEFEFAPVGFHAFNRNEEYVLMLFSREYEHDYKVKVNLPNVGPVSNAKMTILSGNTYSSEDVDFSETTDITVENGMLVDVPRHSMVVITFNGTDFGLTAPLLNDDFVQVTKVNIETGDSSRIIDDNKAYLQINTTVEPDSAYVTATEVVILDADTTGATLKGNLLYPGTKNGAIEVFARSLSDTTVSSDTLLIIIDKSDFTPKPTVALKVNSQPTLTGELDQSWGLAKPVPLTNVVIGQVTPENLSANFRALWDTTYLYLHVEVTDDFIRSDANATAPFDWDGVEVFVDALNQKSSSYIQGNDAQYASAYGHGFDQLWKTWHASKEGVLVNDALTNDGYNKVFAFPLATINVPTDTLPHTMGLDVQVNDNDAGSGRENKITWNATQDNAWNNPSVFGELVLDEYRELQDIAIQGADTVVLNADETYRALVDYFPSNATFTNVTWSSENENVATVSTSGNILAIDEGTSYVKVVAEEGGFSDSILVKVNKPVTGIELYAQDTTLNVNATLQLNASVVPADAFLQEIYWASSDTTVAIVDATGLVTALGVGSAEITATTDHRGFSESINVEVIIPVNGIAFNVLNLTMEVNGSVDLMPLITIDPADATIQDVVWESSDVNVISIDEDGVAQALAEGKSTIKVTSVNGGYSATMTIYVGENPGEEEVKKGRINREYWTDISGATITDLTNDPQFPNQPTGKDYLTRLEAVNWNDPFDNVTWADDYGQRILGYLHPEESGEYTFFIAGDDQCELYLSTDDKAMNKSKIASVAGWTRYAVWDKYSSQRSASVYLEAGEKYYIEVLHKEAGGGDHVSVGWLKPGESGNAPSEVVPGNVLSNFYEVDAITNVTIAINMDIGQELQLAAVIEPYSAFDQSVTWLSSDYNKVAIDEFGTITALAAGQAEITVVTNSGGVEDKLKIIVKVSGRKYKEGEVTSIDDVEDFNVNVYPNPTIDKFTVIIPENMQNAQLTLINSRGQIIRQLQLVNGQEQVEVNAQSMHSGLYILRIEQGEMIEQRKVMVNR